MFKRQRRRNPVVVRFNVVKPLKGRPYLVVAMLWAIFCFIGFQLTLIVLIFSGAPVIDWITNLLSKYFVTALAEYG